MANGNDMFGLGLKRKAPIQEPPKPVEAKADPEQAEEPEKKEEDA